MKFNVAKCKVMHFRRQNPRFEYDMDGKKLQEVEEERAFGITVSNTLKLAKQCAKAATTGRAVLGQITCTFHFRDRCTFVKVL
jgi:hypothetical protein